MTPAEMKKEQARVSTLIGKVNKLDELKSAIGTPVGLCNVGYLLQTLEPFADSPDFKQSLLTLAQQTLGRETDKLIAEGVDIKCTVDYPGIKYTGSSTYAREQGAALGSIVLDQFSQGAAGEALRLMKHSTGNFKLHEDGHLELTLFDTGPRVTMGLVNCGASLKFGADDTHWNPPGSPLPPVGSDLMIKIPFGTPFVGGAVSTEDVILKVQRTAHLEDRDRNMEYRTPEGMVLRGRFDWTHA